MKKLEAVILAAGKGTRLRPYTEELPKSLFELSSGVTLLGFIIDQLNSAGIKDIVVATRPEHVNEFKERFKGKIKLAVVKGEGEFGNLHTLNEALKEVKADKVLVAMSDHVFELEMLRRLLSSKSEKPIVLCLDKNPPWIKLREGLKVKPRGESVDKVGKDIPPYGGIDTGLFLLSREAIEIARETEEEVGPTAKISDMVNRAAERNKAGYVDVTGRLWMDVDTPEDVVEARKLYWRILRRDLVKPTDGPVSRYLNRPISTRISLALHRRGLNVKPNHVSLISFLVGLASAALFLFNFFPLAGLVAHISSVLDGVDGELARLSGGGTRFGEFLDAVLDRFADAAIITSLGISSLLHLNQGLAAMALTALAAFGTVMVSYVSKLSPPTVDQRRLRGGFPWATRDCRLFSVTVGGLLSAPLIPLIFCALSPAIFSVKAIMLHGREGARAKVRAIEPPKPTIKPPEKRLRKTLTGEVRRNLIEIISNGVKLLIWLAISKLFLYAFRGYATIEVWGIRMSVESMVGLGSFIAIVYFGYKILMSIKFFADLASEHFVRRLKITGAAYTRIAMDSLYLAAVALAWFAVSLLLECFPKLWALRAPVGIMFLAIFVLILYDLVKAFYRSLKGPWEAFIDKLSKSISKKLAGGSR